MTFSRLLFWKQQPSAEPCSTAPRSFSRRYRWGNSTWRRRLPRLVSVSVASVAVCLYLDYHPNPREVRPFDPLEQIVHGVRLGIYSDYHYDKIEQAQGKIVLVTINDSTLNHLGGPPVPRRHHAKIVRDLSRAGAKVIAFDLLFKSPSPDAAEDLALSREARRSGRVLWASLFQDESQVSTPGQDDKPSALDAPVRPIEALRQASPHEGHINSGTFLLDNPLVDRVSPVLLDGERPVPSFSFQAARLATDPSAPLERVPGGWRSGSITVPTDSAGSFPIMFLRSSRSKLSSEPIWGPRQRVFPVIPYERIVGGAVDEKFFRDNKYFQGKIVLVGDNSKIGNDRSPTPAGEMSGVEIHAHAIATILAGSYIRPVPPLAGMLAIAFMGGVVCLLASARRLHVVVLGVLGVALAFSLLNAWLLVAYGLWLHMVAPLAALGLAGLAMLVEGGLFQETERERMFDALVAASASAIESRDPATSGHSHRVTALCVALAEAVTHTGQGPLKHARFSREQIKELRYAGLLHDFGKIGVRESVLTKSHKLPPDRFEAVQCRLALAQSQTMLRRAEEKVQVLEAPRDGGVGAAWDEIEYQERLEQMERDAVFLQKCNDPMVTFLPDTEHASLREVLSRLEKAFCTDSKGTRRPVITPEESEALSIRKGSLTGSEYREIQEHSQFSYDFLRQIPWTDSMSAIPEIAYGHHEKLNGSGYPRQLKAEHIPLAVRIMTIADIYDALTAADRPYKKAMPVERALKILQEEAQSGALDSDLLHVFIEQKVYEKAIAVPKPDALGAPLLQASATPPTSPPRMA